MFITICDYVKKVEDKLLQKLKLFCNDQIFHFKIIFSKLEKLFA